ncbi:polycystic kidney disease and receptor for egg jelly-related protein [Athene cunicularia]|uniref:polycystic kidney disease and receptor for egg jelly-related protein n=1 Tax=Athene cunicularia TaxID=194338 RepID=UPI000EF6A093|nr:polycystic kidney disease and receptor for egg jelly-related protein [Athene cunicularia]
MGLLRLLVFLVLGSWSWGWAAPVPRLWPPPLRVTCWGPHGQVSQRRDSERWVSCLWNSTVSLRYQPGPGMRAEPEGKEGRPPPPPRCFWSLNSTWVTNTSRWSGQVTLQTGLPPGSAPPPGVSILLTVRCSSASCAAPECFHHDVTVEMCGQDMRLFVLWPQSRLIPARQPVELGWCARFKSAGWQYRFSSQGGSPSTLLLPSSQHQDTLPPTVYPTAELRQTCATYYSYRLTVRYRRHGLHVASISIEQMPHISLNLSLKVERDLLHVLSISSMLLSVAQQPLRLSWRLQPLSPGTLAYRLVDTQATGDWLRSYGSFTLQSNFCAVPTPQSLGEKVVASIYFHVDGKRVKESMGELQLLNGTLSLTAGREPPIHVNLHPGKTMNGTYTYKDNHGMRYTTKDDETSISTDGPHTRTVFYRQKELSYVLSVEFVAFQWYKFNMYLYMNQKRTPAERDPEVHVFTGSHPSFPQGFTYLVWFIPAQHPMLQCEWTFHLQLLGTQRDRLLQSSTYTYNDHVRNATRFVRRSALPFDPEKYTGFVAKVNCSRSAPTPALLRVTVNNRTAKTIEAPVACRKEACYIHSVRIRRPAPQTSVLRQKKGASFFLFADVRQYCNVGIINKPLWRIYSVKDTETVPDWKNPVNSSGMYGVEMIHLTVPRFTLDYGLYLFNFTVEITPIGTATVLRGTDKIYVQIERDDLVANIVGGTFRTVGFSDDWTLNGSASYDPDSKDGLKGITFTWYCTKELSDYKNMQVSPGKRCHPAQRDLKWLTPSGPVQAVPPESLPGNSVYYFRLEIQKDTRRSYADQTVNVQPGSPLFLNVACLENCGSTLIPTERFILSGKCLNCRTTSQPAYYWSLFSDNSTEVSFDWSSRTSTGRSGPYLSINALTFTEAAHRSYVLQLKVTTWDGRASVYRHMFKVTAPPRAGNCTIHPRWGIAFQTKFVVQCSGFSDSNLPLTYKVIAASNVPQTAKITSVEENTFGTILYFGYEPRTPPSFLPVGVPSQKYTLKLYVQVANSLGAFTQVNLYVRVQNPVNSRPPAVVFHELLASVSGFNAPMTSYLQAKNYFSAGYLAYVAASVLNYIKVTPTLQLPKAQFRESLIETLLNISAESLMDINQVVASLSQVTEEADEVTVRSQDLAVRKLSELTATLKVQRNETHWSEDAEIQSSGILRGLSNILRAALLPHTNVNVNGVKQVFSITETLMDIVFQGKVPGETETLMETKHWNITLTKDETWNITNAFSARNTCRSCFYPSLNEGNDTGLSHDAVISTALFEFEENPFPWLGYTSEIATTVLGFKMAETKANGDLLGIVPEGAEIVVARKDKDSSTFPLAMGPDKTQAYTTGGFQFEVSRNSRSIYIQILTKLKATFKVLVFTGANLTDATPIASFSAFHDKPTAASKNETAGADCNIEAPYIICLPESLLTATAQESATDTYNISVVLLTPHVTRYQTQRLVKIHIFSDQCLFLDGIQSLWREDTCRLGSLTNWQRVHCVCSMKQSLGHLSVHAASNASRFNIKFLAAKVFVPPNRLDLGKMLIAEIPKNPVTLLTVLFIFAAYFLLSFWAVRKDRADRNRKNSIIVLPDNDPFDTESFLVTLHTGSRWGAGTKADVCLQLIGQNGTSDVHCLRHPQFLPFQQGSVDCFLLTTKKDLGDICSLRVWHNNKGPSPSWFLSRAKVENVNTRTTWFFICRKWLSLDHGDHFLERTFSVTNPKTPLPRIDYFWIKLADSLTENHPWFSIFAHVLTGTFSRLQRLSLCLAVLLLDLLVNIMFFNADKDGESTGHLRYLRSIALGIECALMTIPVEIILTALFKYSRKEPSPRHVAQTDPKVNSPLQDGSPKNFKERQQKSYLSETSAQPRNITPLENLPGPSSSQSTPCSRKTSSEGSPQNWSNCTVSESQANGIGTDMQATTETPRPVAKACQRRLQSNSNIRKNYAEEGGNFQKERKALRVGCLPSPERLHLVFRRCCFYTSWALVIAVTGLSSFFIVSYGLSYGYQTSREWLLASATSFIEKVFLISILKAIFFSAMHTFHRKTCEHVPWLTLKEYSKIKSDKEMLSEDEIRETRAKLAEVRSSKEYKPLEPEEVADMWKRAKIKAKAFTFIKGFISHLVFLILLFHFAYSTENANIFHYNRFIRKQFSPGLSRVLKLEHINVWLKDSFLPLIHNEIQPTFLPESRSKIIGLPRMRQVRAKNTEKKCFHPHSFINNFVISKSHCLHKYGSDTPEKGDYAGTWTKLANQSVSEDASSYGGFTYHQNRTPWTYFLYGDLHKYGPDGYVVYFFPEEGRSNSTTRLDTLQQSNWLDENTWAVIIELTTFNMDVGLFCTLTVIFEMSPFGMIKPSLSVHSFTLPIFHQQTKAQVFVAVTALALLFLYIVDELLIIGQEKKDYVKKFSNIINFGLKSAFLLFVFLKTIKFKAGDDIVKFYLLHPNHFINFHAISHLDQILRITTGVLAFLAVLKTLKYCQLLYGVHLAQRLILAALPKLFSMALVAAVYFFAFTASGYLVFGQHEWNYNNMIHSAQTIISYSVSASRRTAFPSNRLSGGLFLAAFTVVMTCVLTKLFQAVILSTYREVKQSVYEEPSEEAQVVAFVLQRLRRIVYLLLCKTTKTSETDLIYSELYRQTVKRHQQHLGLKTRKINGQERVYLVL